ncbi:hypothetical protein [Streptomyces sp. GbtcB6]|uniref:hypothetical protein n=1 Tax=Streptomyces sp. GbtcB6 TaxID=2824751 RepID=UPI001C2FE37C|nr:hypothetical protein [Streptomyces sp. GbtcB6]
MKLGKALATGVAEERLLAHDEVPGLPGLSEEIHEIHEPRAASASEEAPAAR